MKCVRVAAGAARVMSHSERQSSLDQVSGSSLVPETVDYFYRTSQTCCSKLTDGGGVEVWDNLTRISSCLLRNRLLVGSFRASSIDPFLNLSPLFLFVIRPSSATPGVFFYFTFSPVDASCANLTSNLITVTQLTY